MKFSEWIVGLVKPKPIRIYQYVVPFHPQDWIETILLVDDNEAARLNNWTVGYYHCRHCGAWRAFSYQLPEMDKYGNYPANPIAHNDRLDFWVAHAHGDGRVVLFERKMEVVKP